MYSKNTKKMVAQQIIAMLVNNVLHDNGMESFMGWLEDGDAFDPKDGSVSEEDVNEATELAREIASDIDAVSWKLDTMAET